MADVVRRYGLGEAVPPDDVTAWTKAIDRAFRTQPYRDRPEEWEALKREWCWERQAAVLRAVYSDVLGIPLPGAERPRASGTAPDSSAQEWPPRGAARTARAV